MSSSIKTSLPAEQAPGAGASSSVDETVQRLRHWFGREFSLLDGRSGDLLHCAVEGLGDHREHDWGARGEVCREVAAHPFRER